MASFADDDVIEYRSPLESRVSHAEIEALGRQGLSVVSISKQTGVSRISIELVLAKAGVKPNDTLLARPPTAPPRFDHAAAVTAVRAGQSADTVASRDGSNSHRRPLRREARRASGGNPMTLRRRRPPPDLSPSSASWLPPRSQGRPLRRLRSSGRMPLPCGSLKLSRVQQRR